jgi:hypothetical protein
MMPPNEARRIHNSLSEVLRRFFFSLALTPPLGPTRLIFADEFPYTDPGVDTVKVGRGNDGIDAVDGFKDIIDLRQRPRRLRRLRPEQRRGRG